MKDQKHYSPQKTATRILLLTPTTSSTTVESCYSTDSLSTNKTTLSRRSYDDDYYKDDYTPARRICRTKSLDNAHSSSWRKSCVCTLACLFVFVCVATVVFGRGSTVGSGEWGKDQVVEQMNIKSNRTQQSTEPSPTHQLNGRTSPSIISQFIHLYKLPPPLDNDDLHESNRKPSQQHHYYNTGVFRPPKSKLWDPHPQYIFHAFSKRFHLVLNQISRSHSFILPGFKVTTHGRGSSREDWVRRGRTGDGGVFSDPNGLLFNSGGGEGDEFEGCFYNGYVLGDMGSSVAVSLCSGMTGHIRTSTGSYFIEPHHHNQNNNDLLEHEIYQIVSQKHDDDDVKPTTTVRPVTTTRNHHRNYSTTTPSPPRDHNNRDLKITSYDYYSDEDYDSGEYSDEDSYEDTLSPPPSRHKRSLSTERYVELTVVTDQTMSKYHGDNLKHYVLTLLSIVALVYRDASIGNPVNIVLVNFHVLTDTDFSNSGNGSVHGTSASEMLRNFCKWQKEHNHPDDRHALHHDTALLLTRETICRNPWVGKCDTLGLAELGTMCDHYASCAIVQDNGLSAAFTIAHELGHVMNMPHDDDYKCQGFVNGGGRKKLNSVAAAGSFDDDESVDELDGANNVSGGGSVSGQHGKVQHFVMSRMLDHNTYPWAWSRCSRHFLTEFLDAGHGYCLEDKPHSNMLYNDEENSVDTGESGGGELGGVQQPGEIFSEHKQCELVFGPNSQLCSYMPPCRRLWCTNHGGPESEESEGCRTQHMPWADGTRCGANKWCQRGACVLKDLEKLKVVNGDWGGWQEYGECSRPCGGGVKKSFRECDEPKPRNGGKYCVGPRVRYESCNTFECGLEGRVGVDLDRRNSSGVVDFRGSQCGAYDGDNFNIHGLPEDVVWVPKYNGISPKDRCKLFCRVQGSSSYYLLKEKVIDGTTCGIDTFDICVNGACLPAGCDRRLHSDKMLDICGICGGDGSTCTTSQGSYNSTKYGYNTITTIPSGASNIDIRQRSYDNTARDDNYLALFDPISNEYVLNGHFVVSMFRKTLHYGGSVVEYSGSDQVVERINSSSRPTKRMLEVRVLSVGKLKPPDIAFQFVISSGSGDSDHNATFEWQGKRSPDSSACSSICTGVTVPYTTFECVRKTAGATVTTLPTDCEALQKPPHHATPCNTHCTLTYKLTCPESCVNARNNNHTVDCIRTLSNTTQRISEKYCVSGGVQKPAAPDCLSECRNRKARWRWTQWSECSVNGLASRCSSNNGSSRGVQMRNVWCQRFNWRSLVEVGVDNYEVVDGRECEGEKPVGRRACKVGSGGGGICGEWGVDQWSPCSTTCGPGRIRALYACVLKTHSQTQILPPDYCSHNPKPLIERSCELSPCVSYSTSSNWSSCNCDTSTESRNLTCMVNSLPSPDLTACERAHLPKPDESELTRSCTTKCEVFEYMTSDWSPDCRLFNGKHYRHRKVTCGKDKQTNRCTGPQPETKLECGNWKVESGWGGCNGSCSVGVEVRSVGCYVRGVRVAEDDCSGVVGGKPLSERKCYHNCAGNKVNSTGVRSLRMGGEEGFGGGVGGASTKSPYYYYNINEQQQQTYKWVSGAWGKCTRMTTHKSSSSSCPPTQTTSRLFKKHRQVKCVAESSPRRLTTVPTAYCTTNSPQPASSTNCSAPELSSLQPCPTWLSSDWTGCEIKKDTEANCGQNNSTILQGLRTRNVACVQDTNNSSIDESSCSESVPKPDDTEDCVVKVDGMMVEHCSYTYRWDVGNWSQCNFGNKGKKCSGKGTKTRVVGCLRSWKGKSTLVKDEYCVKKRSVEVVGGRKVGRERKPREVRDCSRACSNNKSLFKWVVGGWSNCSRPCGGYGLRSRPVSCHRSNPYAWTDPDPLPTAIPSPNNTNYCAPPKPKEYDYCIVREVCGDEPTTSDVPTPRYVWATTEYSDCTCDNDTSHISSQKRKVFCTNNSKSKVPARHCGSLPKPKRKRKCECNVFGSCVAVKQNLLNTMSPVQDGEYLLKLAGKLGVKVYCHGMTSVDTPPSEYVSLVEENNYSEIYDKRLIRPESCPRNGSRMGSCECVSDRNRRVGVTNWRRVKLNVTNLVVDVSDFQFSTSTQDPIPFGTAGDCYSSSMNCAQGRFSIDLRNTGFAVSSLTSWTSTGHRATMKVIRKSYGNGVLSQFVQGKCGGYCGSCGVHKSVGLRVDVV